MWTTYRVVLIFFLLTLDATNDSYSVSQTQTINFTQQTLRQRQAQPPNAQQAPQSQAQQQSQLGMQMNMNAQNSGENRDILFTNPIRTNAQTRNYSHRNFFC